MVLALLLAAPAAAGPAGEPGFDPFGMARIDERPGAVVPMDAPFRNADGKITNLRELGNGKPVLLIPVLHNCPNICGVTLAGVADAIAGQPLRPGRDFALVAFGIDPRETPKDAATNLSRLNDRLGASKIGPVFALTGTNSTIHDVTGALGYRYAWDQRIGQYAHVAATAVLTPEGQLSGWLYGLAPRPADLHQAIVDARQDKEARWGDRLLLLCFHYDPVTGRYTASIEKILRLAAAMTVIAIGTLIWRLRGASA
ncbi:protein SCO1/2 [Novosphingobium sp. PhB165]|uniref:SCO family protein n=1 Tax=Novosphingobium sp. PhB165 TaxID=2485105 RepID=UPI0010CE63A9|nr:SCO family protein [Novosphingobium sp. PhB165]TCM14376.1 protein SCO1/2 [Novosphingobium sp. PhB165]